MKEFTFFAGVLFGALTLATITALAIVSGDALAMRLALLATIFGYVTQVLEHYRATYSRLNHPTLIVWFASVAVAVAAIARII